MNQINQRRDFSKSYSSVRRPFAKSTAQMAHTNAVIGSWGSAVKSSAKHLRNRVDRGFFDSGCSGTLQIGVGNLDFDSVSFVKELGHFNLFSISQICDKQHKVSFYETECLVVSSDFKMPDENQILLKVPRHHNMYSFDMKTPSPAKGFACLLAKATSDESKLFFNCLRKKDEEVEIIVVPSAVKIPEEKDASRTTSKNSKPEETLKEPQQDVGFLTNPKIQAFEEVEDIALSILGNVLKTTLQFIKVVKALYGLAQALKLDSNEFPWCELTLLLRLQVIAEQGRIFISQVKYVAEILKKFDIGL
ncbi:hypothetical protein Tco_0456627 [Tanacetum coccineum]